MITLVNALKQSSIDAESFDSSLGVTSYWGTKTYIQLDLKNGGWSVVRLSLIQRIFRALLGWYQNTKLEHVLVSIRCEALRKGYSDKERTTVEKLTKYLDQKWFFHNTAPYVDWRLSYYAEYAKIWNHDFLKSNEGKVTQIPVFSFFTSQKSQVPFPDR